MTPHEIFEQAGYLNVYNLLLQIDGYGDHVRTSRAKYWGKFGKLIFNQTDSPEFILDTIFLFRNCRPTPPPGDLNNTQTYRFMKAIEFGMARKMSITNAMTTYFGDVPENRPVEDHLHYYLLTLGLSLISTPPNSPITPTQASITKPTIRNHDLLLIAVNRRKR